MEKAQALGAATEIAVARRVAFRPSALAASPVRARTYARACVCVRARVRMRACVPCVCVRMRARSSSEA